MGINAEVYAEVGNALGSFADDASGPKPARGTAKRFFKRPKRRTKSAREDRLVAHAPGGEELAVHGHADGQPAAPGGHRQRLRPADVSERWKARRPPPVTFTRTAQRVSHVTRPMTRRPLRRSAVRRSDAVGALAATMTCAAGSTGTGAGGAQHTGPSEA